MLCPCVLKARHLQRIVNVPPEIGYGDQGIGEIPPGATVQLQVELLKVLK